MERVLILVSFLLVAVYAGPIQLSADRDDICSRSCTENSKFNYMPGRTYNYKYESDIKTQVQGASEDHSSLHLSALVQLEILSKCEITMRLNDVTFTEYDPVDTVMKDVSSDFKAGLEKFPVRISYQDGGIEDICLSGEEPTWVLNAKRGIISLIQNNMNDFATNHTVKETDVSGVCDTEYFVRDSSWYSATIGKSKNLLGCTDRHGYNTAIQGVPYTAESDIQSLPLLKSDHNCVHEIDKRSGFLKSVQCTEQHMFRPFSQSNSGAVTISTQSLTYQSETTGTKSPAPILTRVSLKFDHVHNAEEDGRSRKNIIRKLTEICEKTKSGVLPETPKLFTDLVYIMKSADIETLSDINKMLTGGNFCPDNLFRTRKFFLDALPMTGSSASLHMITELITSNVITGAEADMWLTTLSFIKNPTQDMLKEVKPLINAPDSSEKALLSVGTLVHSYCFHHGNCENDGLVKAIVSAFTNKMSKGCKVNENDMKTTLLALRGIGNAGYAESAIPKLTVCMKLKSNPIEIRLSAIEAFRRMPCGSDRVALMALLQDTEEDSEIRIAAYRVLMECPSDRILGVVRKTLAKEEVNQVGSYIWTHLTNLMETSDRHKQDIRALLEDETFKKEFDLDKRKFSRNYEGSVFIERLNTGAKLEGDLIWSSKSFIPRSAMMNLTFDLFGHSVNVFEIGGRAEGLEYFLESFFGPNGYFGNPEENPSSNEVVPKNIRGDKIKKIDKRFSAKLDDLRGSLYMRMFGNELRYMNFKGMESLLSGPDFNILEMLIKLSEDNDYTYTHSAMFLDSSYIVPTSSGFPLNLTVNGSATVDLRMKGKMDLRHPPTVDVEGLIKPSAAVDISSMMGVDAFFTRSGIKMVSTLHTSTAVQGKLSIDRDGSITTEYEMPEPRMEIIDVKSSFFTVHRDTEREQKMIKENRQTLSYCSPEQVVTVTGLELCAEVDYPNASMKADAPYFPLTGPVSAGIYLYNRDTHTKYKMEAKSIHNKDKNIVRLAFNTPGSRIDRHVEVDFSLDIVELTVDATLTSPWKKANIQGTIVNTNKASGISGKMNIDGKSPYSFDAKLARDVNGNAYIFRPSIDIQANRQMPISAKGMVNLKKNWKQLDVQIDLEGTITGPFSAQLTINNKDMLRGVQGSMSIAQNKEYSFDLNLATTEYKKKVLYKPLFSIRTPAAEVLAFGGGVTHIYGKGLDINLVLDKVVAKKITLTGKLNKAVKRRRSIYNTKLDFRSSPADFLLKAKFDKRSAGTIASDIDFTYVIRRVTRNNIKLVSKITNQSSKSLTKAKAAINLAVKRNPEFNMKILSELSHNKKHTEIDGDIWYGKDFKNDEKHVDIRFEMNRNLKSLMSASADIQTRVKVPELDFIFMTKGEHSHDEKNLNSSLMFKFGKGEPIETSLKIQDKTDKLMKVDAEYQLSIPGYNFYLEHALEQTIDNRYISKLTTQKKKGQQSKITTTIIPNSRKIAFNSDINFFGESPSQLKGEFGIEPTDFITSLSFEKDSKLYAGSLASATEIGKSSWLTLDILNPSRHMKLSLKGANISGLISGDAEFQWDTNQKVTVKTWLEKPTSEKLNGSVTVSYPTRTLILNAHHTKESKYSSHLDFQWHPEKKISADTVLDLAYPSIIGNAKISTPFSVLPNLALEAKCNHDSEQYDIDGSVSWVGSNKISLKSEIKKPVSMKTLVGSVSVKSSRILNGLKSVELDVNHKLSNSLASEVRLGWNRQFVQTIAVLQNTTKGKKIGFEGSLELKTSYQYIKKGKVIISHDNNARNFNTIVSINRNRKAYKMVSKITHQPSQDIYDNSGSILISSPTGNVETTWNHKHSDVNIATTLTSTWGKNKVITGRFNSNFDDSFSATLGVQTPFAVARDTLFQATYTRANGLLDGKVDLSVNGNKLGSAEVGYTVEDDNYAAGVTIMIPDLNVDTKLEAKISNPEDRTALASLNAIITPEITMSLEGTQKIFKSGSLAHTQILWKSSFPGYEQVRYSYEVLADDHLTTITRLQYSKSKEIKLETAFAYERSEKHLSALLTTPFESLPKLNGGINVLGDLDAFTSEIFAEIQPVLDRTSAKFIWNTTSGLMSSLRIDLPVAEHPYFQADVKGMFSSQSSDMNLKIEYKPKDIVQLEMTHNLSGTDLKLSAKAGSPFGTVSVQHDGNPLDFSCKLKIENWKMNNYGLDVAFTNADKITGTMTISMPGRSDILVLFTHTGDAFNFNTHAEVQHNRKNSFISDLNFIADKTLKLALSGSLRTQFISDTEEYDALFHYDGIPMKFNTHGEFSTTSLGKSQAEVNLDMVSSTEGSFVIKSPLMRNIKSSFNHFQRDHYSEANVDVVHGGRKLIDMQVNLNKLDSVIGEIKLKTPFFENIALMTRFDGDISNFVIRTEGAYGVNKADLDLSSKTDTNKLQQKISLSATGMEDISAEISHNGNLSQLKSYGELNIGQNRHRVDIIFSNTGSLEGSFSFESPLIKPVVGNFQVSGRLYDFRSHAELTVASDISAADMSYSYGTYADVSLDISIRSPFIKDVTVSLSNIKREQDLSTKGHLSIEGMEDFDVKFSSASRPFTVILALNTPFENFTNFDTSFTMKEFTPDSKGFHFEYTFNEKKTEVDASYRNVEKYTGQLSIKSHLTPDSSVSFEHEGKWNNFRGHAEYSIGSKKSELDIFYSGLSRHEGLMTVKSHLTPDLSAGFEHDGTWENFKSHGEYSIGFDKREFDISVNVEKNVDINMQYKCPIHGISTAAISQTGVWTDFTCHAEITRSAEKWEGDLSFSSANTIKGQIMLKPSYSSTLEPLTMSFEHTGSPTNFRSHSEFILGEEKTTNDLEVVFSDRVVSTSLKITTPYYRYRDVSANFRSEGEPKNFNLHAGFDVGSDQMDTDFALTVTNSSIGSSFSLKSSLCKDITGKFNLGGTLADFSSDINIKIDSIENIGHFSFKKTVEEVASTLDIKSAYMDDISINVHHSGDLAKFTTQYETSIAGKSNKALVDLNLRDNIKGKVSIDEPKFLVEGSFKEGAVSVSLSKELDEYSAAFSYSFREGILFDGRISSPFEGYRTLSASYEHSGSLRNFKCTGKLAIEREESTFNLRLNTEDLFNVDGSFDLSSPYVFPINFKINNVIKSAKYIANVELNRDGQKILGMFASASNNEGKGIKEGHIEIFVTGIKHNILDLTTTSSEFVLSSEVISDSKSNKLKLSFSRDPKLVGTFSLISPYRQIQASIDFEGSLYSFVGSSDLIVDGEQNGHVTVSLNTVDKLDAEFTIQLPFIKTKELSGELSFIPGNSAFKMEAMMKSEFRNIFDLNLDFDIKNKGYINFDLESKKPHPLSAKLLLTNENQALKMNWELIHESKNLVNGNVDFKVKTEPVFIQGTAFINTQYFQNSIDIHIEPDTMSYKTEASLTRNSENYAILTRFNGLKDIDAEFRLNIPKKDEIKGTFSHTQRTYRSKTGVELKLNATHHVEYDMDLRWRNGFEGSISVTTPFKGLENTKVKIEHEGSFPTIKSSAEIKIDEKMFGASATTSRADDTKAAFTLTTPFEPVKNLALSMYHSGELSNFRTGGKLTYATGEDIELDIDHMWIGLTQQTKARFMSPYTDEVIISANHSGKISDFSSAYELTLGTDLKYMSKTSLKTGIQFLTFSNVISSTMSGETFEQTIELKHDGSIEKFKTEALLQSLGYVYRVDTSFQLDPVMEGSLELVTPFENFKDIKASFTHTGSASGILTTGEVQFAPLKTISGKIDVMQFGWRRMVTNIELRTPFKNMKVNKLAYKHSGDSDSFQCEVESFVYGKDVSGTVAASMKPISMNLDIKTPFKGFETIGLNGNFLSNKKNHYSSRMQAKWNPTDKITVEGSLSTSGPIDAEISILTPFKPINDASIVISQRSLAKGKLESLKITHNSKHLIDIEVDHSLFLDHKHILVTTRAPKSMKFELDGEFTLSKVDFDLEANWNTKDINSNLRAEVAYDVSSEKTASFKLIQSRLPGKIISFSSLLNGKYSKADLAWGLKPEDKIGYEITIGDYDGSLRLVLPTRSLVFAGSHRGKVTEGSFMWDADVDESRKVAFSSRTVTASNVAKAYITISMPSLGKNVQVGSEISVNQGRVIFDGKTVLSYSGDSRKNLEFTSKLEDISTGGSRNYSFSFGVSHPYTTLDVKVRTHAGRSNTGYSAGVGLEYLTVKKQSKKFQIGARIDKLMKTISFELQSPVKSVRISGSAQTDKRFRLSLLNVYDQRNPLSTTFTFDSATRSIDFITHFDLDNPRSEFHINAKYVNSSAVATEVYHIINREKVTDVLITARLNTSHLLHSRLHWRPEMIKDLEAFMKRKMQDYHRRLRITASRTEPEIVEEVTEKFRMIWGAIEEEIGTENIASFEAAVVPFMDIGLQTTIAMSQPILQKITEVLSQSRNNNALLRHNPVTVSDIELTSEPWNTDVLDFIKQKISDNFNYVSDQVKLPRKHIPGYVRNIMTGAINYTEQKMPVPVSSQIGALRSSGLIDVIESFIEKEISTIETNAEKQLRDIEDIIMGHIKSPFTVYDPAHGEIQVELYSLIPLQSLDKLPVINFVQYIEKIKALKKTLSKSIPEVTVPDFTGEWIPPFTGVASVKLGHRITTFDGYVYDLDSDCTYILARDYVHGNFSLILSNDGNTTLTVLSSGLPISVNIQGEVLVGGKPAHLPATNGDITVTQADNGVVTIKGGKHFTVEYDLTVDHMTIQVSGWYHGRTGGLLGIYDNEPSNDQMTSFNKVVGNSSRFAKTWDVGTTSCR